MRKAEGTPATLPFITRFEELSNHLSFHSEARDELDRLSKIFPFRIPKFYLSLMDRDDPACPLRRQAVPTPEELDDKGGPDPLDEHDIALTPSFLRRYPGRGVFLASSQCAMYCRFCNRRRLVGKGWDPKPWWEDSFSHMEKAADLKEIIVSGGDPLMIPVDDFTYIVERLKRLERIKTIRVSTRLPVVHPEGLKEDHFTGLSKLSPVWLVIHINHPREISPEFIDAVRRFRSVGASILSQTVLLRGVNDCPGVLLKLFEALVALGVKPYYLFQLDEVRGAMHFKVRLSEGIKIMRYVRRYGSGLAVPTYALDITGGLGKVPIDYRYWKRRKGRMVYLENTAGSVGSYLDDGGEREREKCGECEYQACTGNVR